MVTLYTTHCPRCTVLEKKLQQKNIEYQTNEDVSKLIQMGFRSAPVLCVDDKYYEFPQAVNWLNTREAH